MELFPLNKRFFVILIMRTIILSLIILYSSLCAQNEQLKLGADISFLEQLDDLNAKFFDNGEEKPLLDILKNHGFTYIRLRIWHTPPSGYNDLESTLYLARRIKDAGMKLYLDFHYSDSWADPGQQAIPTAWQNLEFDTLVDSFYNYTYDVINALKSQNTPPDIIQLGNEISCGFLWDVANICDENNTHAQWLKFTGLLNTGINAIHDVLGDSSSVQIMIHTDKGGDSEACRWFFSKLEAYGVQFDLIGLSYYPWWHGDLNNLKENLDYLSWRFEQKIFLAEIAYPWTLANQDWTNNFVWNHDQLIPEYPATVTGQTEYFNSLFELLTSYDGKVAGASYWEPAFRGIPGMNSPWENQTLFDFYGNLLPSISAFENISTTLPETITETRQFRIIGNFPNPMNSDTFITLYSPIHDLAIINIFNAIGERTKSYQSLPIESGINHIKLELPSMSSGIYFCQVITAQYSQFVKLLVVK